jgi:hypothetical protein
MRACSASSSSAQPAISGRLGSYAVADVRGEAMRTLPSSYCILAVYHICCCRTKPETDASNKYRNYSKNVWSTRWRGNITLTIDGNGKGTIQPEYNR